MFVLLTMMLASGERVLSPLGERVASLARRDHRTFDEQVLYMLETWGTRRSIPQDALISLVSDVAAKLGKTDA